MPKLFPLLGALIGSQFLGPTVTDWLGGPTQIPATRPTLPELPMTSNQFTINPPMSPEFISRPLGPEQFGLVSGEERQDVRLPALGTMANPKGTTLGIANEKLGPLFAGSVGSVALGPLAGLFGDSSESEVSLPRPPPFRQERFGRIATSDLGGLLVRSRAGYPGQQLRAEQILRLLRSRNLA